MIAIYDSNRPGFAGILVDTEKELVLKDLVKVTDGWGLARDYKREHNIRGATERVAKPFPGFAAIPKRKSDGSIVKGQPERPNVLKKYNIATRFDFMESLVNMVISGVVPSCIITGPGGIGKTYTVTEALTNNGIVEGGSGGFIMVKGFTTPLGMYKMLHDNRHAIIVFDDCDSAFKEPTALNLLKGALDSTERRVISWNSSKLPDDLQTSFEFKGRILFVSNIPLNGFDQTLISRSMVIDLQMTREEILDRIDQLKEKLAPGPADAKSDVITFLKERKDLISDLNLRTYLKVLKIRCHAKAASWKGMAEFMCCS